MPTVARTLRPVDLPTVDRTFDRLVDALERDPRLVPHVLLSERMLAASYRTSVGALRRRGPAPAGARWAVSVEDGIVSTQAKARSIYAGIAAFLGCYGSRLPA